MAKLTAKQAAFCREYVVDCNGTQAAIRAGYSERTAQEQASQMLALPHIDAEVKRLQAIAIDAVKITIEEIFKIFLEAVEVARRKESASGMTNAGIAIAKLKGWWVEKTEDLAERERIDAERARIGEVRKAGQLLADAAKSLDLPERATPAQIVGALAERPLITPEAFTLLREARMAENAG